MEASQQLRLSQEMRLSPRIIQAMEILQLPILALQERIDKELESNPVLEMHESETGEEAPPTDEAAEPERGERAMVVQEKGGHEEDFQRLDRFVEEYGSESVEGEWRRGFSGDGERDRKLDAMANTPAPAQSLDEYLLEQWAFVEAPPPVKAAGEAIISHVAEDGYLRTPLEEIAAGGDSPPAVADLEAAIKLVQGLDPIGVGARDLKECLLLQLAVEEAAGADVSLEKELVQHHLSDIEMNRLPLIAKRTGKTVERVKQAIENLSHLNPRPGLLVGPTAAPIIRPDVFVDLDERGEVVITIPEGDTPRLYVSGTYRKLVRDRKADRTTRQFISKNIRSAQWLIDAILQRRRTVRRVVEEVFAAQKDFLESGEEALHPLPMSDVARKVGVHVATVSRAVSGKYVQTPRGIFPLRMFFSGGKAREGGQDVAWDAIKARLKELVETEDKANPLGDDELVAEMQKLGIVIARRTIAKYRSILKIPPARRRQQY
jgi:RNA polymerase sigma-54 factor